MSVDTQQPEVTVWQERSRPAVTMQRTGRGVRQFAWRVDEDRRYRSTTDGPWSKSALPFKVFHLDHGRSITPWGAWWAGRRRVKGRNRKQRVLPLGRWTR